MFPHGAWCGPGILAASVLCSSLSPSWHLPSATLAHFKCDRPMVSRAFFDATTSPEPLCASPSLCSCFMLRNHIERLSPGWLYVCIYKPLPQFNQYTCICHQIPDFIECFFGNNNPCSNLSINSSVLGWEASQVAQPMYLFQSFAFCCNITRFMCITLSYYHDLCFSNTYIQYFLFAQSHYTINQRLQFWLGIRNQCCIVSIDVEQMRWEVASSGGYRCGGGRGATGPWRSLLFQKKTEMLNVAWISHHLIESPKPL